MSKADADPKSLHLGFLTAKPKHPDLKRLESLMNDSERFHLIDRVFSLHAPDGMGRSKLAAVQLRRIRRARLTRLARAFARKYP